MHKNISSRIPALFVVLSVLISIGCQAAAPASQEDLTAAIDKKLAQQLPSEQPGAAVIVVQKGKVIFEKGYGMADVENDVAITPAHVFRLGSITKQFTAVGIMMLMEEGKLALDDDITKYLPDYPANGNKFTIRHLLTHTSGIKSYTGMEKWQPLMMQDLTVDQMMDIFKNEPLDFKPGERFLYNNSGYFLLGAIIEKVSGQNYADFIQERIFTPLAMNNSYYGSTSRIIPHRARGYSRTPKGFINSSHLSMTHPYAAGSLLSTVEDMAKWDAALYGDKLLSQKTLELMWVKNKLNSGAEIDYGFGWGIRDYKGRKLIAHGGGINGFSTYAMRFPEDKLYIAVLCNVENPIKRPEILAGQIADLILAAK